MLHLLPTLPLCLRHLLYRRYNLRSSLHRYWREREGRYAQSRPPLRYQPPAFNPPPRTPKAKAYGDPPSLSSAVRLTAPNVSNDAAHIPALFNTISLPVHQDAQQASERTEQPSNEVQVEQPSVRKEDDVEDDVDMVSYSTVRSILMTAHRSSHHHQNLRRLLPAQHILLRQSPPTLHLLVM